MAPMLFGLLALLAMPAVNAVPAPAATPFATSSNVGSPTPPQTYTIHRTPPIPTPATAETTEVTSRTERSIEVYGDRVTVINGTTTTTTRTQILVTRLTAMKASPTEARFRDKGVEERSMCDAVDIATAPGTGASQEQEPAHMIQQWSTEPQTTTLEAVVRTITLQIQARPTVYTVTFGAHPMKTYP